MGNMVQGIIKRSYNFAKPIFFPEVPFPDKRGMVGSYSQNGEDLIIDALLGCKPEGVYVDIGANDPVALSNTKRFYDRGWSGLCIEPNPQKYVELCQQRPRDIILNIGISDVYGHEPFFVLDHDSVSTFDLKTAKETNLERGTKIQDTLGITIKRLEAVLPTYLDGTPIDFMSIDVEGYEMKVLSSNDWTKYRPKVIVIEINNNPQQILDYLYAQKYLPVMRNAENAIFVAQ